MAGLLDFFMGLLGGNMMGQPRGMQLTPFQSDFGRNEFQDLVFPGGGKDKLSLPPEALGNFTIDDWVQSTVPYTNPPLWNAYQTRINPENPIRLGTFDPGADYGFLKY